MGPLLCLVSAACFGAMAIFGKLAYDAGVSPQALVLFRFLLAAAVLTALAAPRIVGHLGAAGSSWGPRARVMRRPVLTALGLGAVGYATQGSLYFSALERTDASLVALVLYTYPALVTLAAAVLGRERLTARRVAALTAASFGTLLVLLGAGASGFDPVGVTLALGAAVTYTAYILVADTAVHRLSPVVLSALVMIGAALALSVRAAVTGGVTADFGLAGWFWVSCIAVVSTVGAMLAFFAGLKRTGPATASILSTFEPVATTALAGVVLDEFLTPVQLVGGLLVLSSVAVLQLRARRIGEGPLAPSHGGPRRERSSHATRRTLSPTWT
jgi:drug/metabolite transporter (DMT)-like permease